MSSFAFKLIAIVAMTCNHAAYIFAAQLPPAALCALVGVGGFAFPIMAFLLVEGYKHTSNVRNYALRLLVFAVVAQIPYTLFLGHYPNVLFTLMIGLLALCAMDRIENQTARMSAVAALFAASIPCDWGLLGPLMVLLFRNDDRAGRKPIGATALVAAIVAIMAGYELAQQVVDPFNPLGIPSLAYAACCLASGFALASYNGQRGKPLKYFFYAYYPAHIAVLGLAYLALFGTLPAVS